MMIFEGALSVKAALESEYRSVKMLYLDEKKKDRDISYMISLAKRNNVPVRFMKREVLNEMASGRTHGGVLCEVGERTFQQLDECLEGKPFICVLEGVEDPFNLGYALRTLYSAGCTGVLLKKRDWSYSESVICRSSAGAFEKIRIVQSEQLGEDLLKLKKQGLKLFCAYRKDAVSYFEADFDTPLILAIGGEMRGLSREVLELCDEAVYIPYANDFRNALNASSAVAALSYEILRQRSK